MFVLWSFVPAVSEFRCTMNIYELACCFICCCHVESFIKRLALSLRNLPQRDVALPTMDCVQREEPVLAFRPRLTAAKTTSCARTAMTRRTSSRHCSTALRALQLCQIFHRPRSPGHPTTVTVISHEEQNSALTSASTTRTRPDWQCGVQVNR